MKIIDKIYVNGQFTAPHGTETQDLYNPATGEKIGIVHLGDQIDTDQAIESAKTAFLTFSKSTLKERGEILQRLHDAILANEEALNNAAVEEYGSPISATKGRTRYAAQIFLDTKAAMEGFEFEKQLEYATIVNEPLGVIAAITPWNADYTHICGKLAPAIAAGCTIVIKPSELSAIQTQILTECFDQAGVPNGVINIVNGTGPVVGAVMTAHPDIAAVTFTGSTQIGRLIGSKAAETMKRVTLELGGKSPNIILEDADLQKAIPLALAIGFSNSGQACHAGTRIIVPESKLEEIKKLIVENMKNIKIGDLWSAESYIGPMVSQKQYDTVQRYIQSGWDQGAEILVGGLGHPEGLGGFYAKPTVFVNVESNMIIAKEEIFGPVLCVITYKTEEEAINIANDTIYGLSAYISSGNAEKAKQIARQIISGRVLINTAVNRESKAPFGGFKQSGIGRTSWAYGIEEYVEPKVIAL
ncbi:aldehyde dehydrogenase family protein [Flavobacterium circumlabens]|uniref:Aldehyde dehydrogenase (NAD+) n=1 Tax=Flavobacterium circumlabens TaxID=2133765 RepID=A0A4Y7UB00_9FLAO|nr:aldehyde dehydrogenase family protein [Flavobacterium circumlabens]TCN55649.1 aldehyde dehydrogenase (NAD+) [Flavobacterium circumlabens]TEB42952.1 aldehyde dehydrogenase family protein [Flavobacterium circumlabens]